MLKNDASNNSFDKLVSGISAEERRFLLERLKQEHAGKVPQSLSVPDEQASDTRALHVRIQTESLLYRFVLWLRALLTNQSRETLYNKDFMADEAKKIARAHPGLIDFPHSVLESIFYEKLKDIHDCASFFKPYIAAAYENSGEFYVFLSTFVAPEIAEHIDNEADPYAIPFDRPLTNELRVSLARKLDAAIRDISSEAKANMYEAVRAVEWLRQFTALPYLHFLAQFTAIASSSHTCPFGNAHTDYTSFARVLSNGVSISNEVLESLFFFVQRKATRTLALDADSEKALKDFLKKAAATLSSIRMFIETVPLVPIGRIVHGNCTWFPEPFGGAEDWAIKFRGQWKAIFDERWNSWLADRKKHQLVDSLTVHFGLEEFPELPYRPWASLWGGIPFRCEMTAGFLAWFASNKYGEAMPTLTTLMLEGIFLKNENRIEFSEAVNDFASTNKKIEAFTESLAPRGTKGIVFESIASEHIRSLKGQERIDSLMLAIEAEVRELGSAFCKECRTIENIFSGIFNESKSADYDVLQNFMTIQGRDNQDFRDKMLDVRSLLQNAFKLLAEIEPFNLPREAPSDAAGAE
mgnify:FL=1